MDEHYVALLAIFWLQFLCNFDFYEGYMVLICAGDEEHLTPIWSVKTLSSPNFVPTSPIFCQIEVEHHNLSAKDQNLLCTYLGRDIKKGKVDNLFGIHAGVDKHRYHTLYLETMQGLQIGDMSIPQNI